MDQDEFNYLFKFDFLKRTTLAAKNNYNTNTILELIVGRKGIRDLIRDGYYDLAFVDIGKVVEQVLGQLGNVDNDIRKAFPIHNYYEFNQWSKQSVKEKLDFINRLGIYNSLILKKIDDLRANRNGDAHFNIEQVEINKGKNKNSEEIKRQNVIESVKELHDVLLYFHKMYETTNTSDTFFDTKLNDIYIPTKTNQKLHRNDADNHPSSYSSTSKTPMGNYGARHNIPYNGQNIVNPSSGSNYGHNYSSNKPSSHSNYDRQYSAGKPSGNSNYDHNYSSSKPSSYSNYDRQYSANKPSSHPNYDHTYSTTTPSSSSNYNSSYNRSPHNMYSNSSSNYNNEDEQGRKPVSPWKKRIMIWGPIILLAIILTPALNSCLDKYNASYYDDTSETNTDDSDSDQSSDEKKKDPDLKWKKQFAGQVFRLTVQASSPDDYILGDEDVDFSDIGYFAPNLMNDSKDDDTGTTYVVFDSNIKSNKVVVTDQFSTATDAYRHHSAFNKLFEEQSSTGKNYYSIKNNGLTLDICKIKINQSDRSGAYPTLSLSSTGLQKVDNTFKNIFKNEDIRNFATDGDNVDFYDQDDLKELTLSGNDFEKYFKHKPLTVKYKFDVQFRLMDMDDSDY